MSPKPLSSTFAVAGLTLSLLATLGAGCGSGNTTIDPDTNTLSTRGEDGATFTGGNDVKIPETFPADFPRYPDGKTTLAYTDAGGTSGSLVQETPDTLEQAQARIEQLMQAQGFQKTQALPAENIMILSFTKGTVRFQVNITRQGNTTRIQSTRVQG